MKKIISVVFAVTVFTISCKNESSKKSDGQNNKEKISSDSNNNQGDSQDIEKVKQQLVKLTPMSLDQIKALIPETLMNFKKTKSEAATNSGIGTAMAEYHPNDTTTITLNIYDCAGAAGADIYDTQFTGLVMNVQQGDTKNIDINGVKGFEHCDNNDCTITWFSGNRFIVTLLGDNTGSEILKKAAQGLTIK